MIYQNYINSPDYKDWNDKEAIQDFCDRIDGYQKVYQPLSSEVDGEDSSFIKLIDFNGRIEAQNIKGFFCSKLLSFLLNVNIRNKTIYLTRHGETENFVNEVLGTDSNLSENGIEFSKLVFERLLEDLSINELYNKSNCRILTSSMKSTKQSASYLTEIGTLIERKDLDDLHIGELDGVKISEFQIKFEKEFNERQADKLNFRFYRGESYRDLIKRTESMIFDLERSSGVTIVVGHQSVLRCLYGYFISSNFNDIPHLDFPKNEVIKLIPELFYWQEERIPIVIKEITPIKNRMSLFENGVFSIPVENELNK